MYQTLDELAEQIMKENSLLEKNRQELKLFVQFTSEFENSTIRDWRAFKNAHAAGITIDQFKNLKDCERIKFLGTPPEILEFDSLPIFKKIV